MLGLPSGMLIGAHVSTSGGLRRAHERGVEWGADAIQIFNQSPRMWRPTRHGAEDIEGYRELAAASTPRVMVIHAVYLINCAAAEPEIREKSLHSLVHALRLGDAVGAAGVVLHPGSKKKQDREPSLELVAEALRHGLAESESCPLLLENTAGAGDTLGRSLAELAELIDRTGGDERLGLCLDCCHMLASGIDVRTAGAIGEAIDECDRLVGLERLRCLHVNDSKTPLGSNRDRHAPLGDGELGSRGCAAFLSEPRFEALPAIFEGPGVEGKAPAKADMDRMKRLRSNGLRARKKV